MFSSKKSVKQGSSRRNGSNTESGSPLKKIKLKQSPSIATVNQSGQDTEFLSPGQTAGTFAGDSPGIRNPTYGFGDPDPSVIAKNRVDSTVQHEVFLKSDQKEMKRVMNKKAHEKRQQDLVYENGLDQVEEMENDLAIQKARFEQSIAAKNEALRKKKLQKLL